MSRFALSETVMIASARRAAEIDQRAVEEHAPRRVVPRVHREAHVVNRHDGRHRRGERNHAVGEVRNVRTKPSERARRHRLHPHDAGNPRRRRVDPHARGQRPRRIHRPVGHHDHVVVGALLREVMQQVLGVVPDPGSSGPKRGSVKRDAHVLKSAAHRRPPGQA